jgi:formate hydrogenlyase subunit 6/NADH:ubiquinone oxidoreductase subunit I
MSTPRHRLGDLLGTVLGSLFSKPATIKYPYAPFKMPDKFRGPPSWDSDRCVGCKLCQRDCPSQAIVISKSPYEKRYNQTVDLGKCVYCGQCAETCPRKVITITPEFELAQVDKAAFTRTFRANPPPPPAPAPAQEAAPGSPAAGQPEKGAGST